MIIDSNTTAWQVAERIGGEATEEDGRLMLELLLAMAPIDTADIPEDDWLAMVESVCAERRASFAAFYPDGQGLSES